jgi:hypothetical protein
LVTYLHGEKKGRKQEREKEGKEERKKEKSIINLLTKSKTWWDLLF